MSNIVNGIAKDLIFSIDTRFFTVSHEIVRLIQSILF